MNPSLTDRLPGDLLGVSNWLTIAQADIDAFARVTRDWDPMHVDPEWARTVGPFGTTVAFGFLSLSLLTHFSHQANPWPAGVYALNYGFDRIRFVAPVPVNSRVRGRFVFKAANVRDDGAILVRIDASVEIEDTVQPAVVAEWLSLVYPGKASS